MTTKVTIGDAVLWEKVVAPPPLPDVLPVTMHNTTWRTAPRKLSDMPPVKFEASYFRPTETEKQLVEALEKAPQRIKLSFQRTLFTFSPRGRAYVQDCSLEFWGSAKVVAVDGGNAEVSITPINAAEQERLLAK